MIAATVTPINNDGRTLRFLVNAAVPNQIPDTFSGRVAEIHLQFAGGAGTSTNVSWRSGLTDFPENGYRLQEDRRELTLSSPSHNQLTLDDIYLSGTATVRILAFTV